MLHALSLSVLLIFIKKQYLQVCLRFVMFICCYFGVYLPQILTEVMWDNLKNKRLFDVI